MFQEYGLSEMTYNGLKAAIPKEWRMYFSENRAELFLPLVPCVYDLCIAKVINNLSQKVYKFLAEDEIMVHGKYLKNSVVIFVMEYAILQLNTLNYIE